MNVREEDIDWDRVELVPVDRIQPGMVVDPCASGIGWAEVVETITDVRRPPMWISLGFGAGWVQYRPGTTIPVFTPDA